MKIKTTPTEVAKYVEGIEFRENIEALLNGLSEDEQIGLFLQRKQVKFCQDKRGGRTTGIFLG